MKFCPKCRKIVSRKYLFCPKCGVSFQKVRCNHCSKALPHGAEYCPYCGKTQIVESVVTVHHSPVQPVPVTTSDTSQAKYKPERKVSPIGGNSPEIKPIPGLAAGELLIIPKGTKEIRVDEFKRRNNIRQAILPEGLESIGDLAFYGCTNLVKINFPSSLKKYGQQVFYEAWKLKSAGPYGCGSSIEFEPTEKIYDYMFFNCQFLTRIDFPGTLRIIGKKAFWNCKSLNEVCIPDGVKEIEEYAFQCCSGLKKLVLPDSVEKIGTGAFAGCDQLCNQDGFIIIRSVLYGCINPGETICVPQGVTTIDRFAFRRSTSLCDAIPTREIVIPDSVVNIISNYTFLDCDKLEKVIVSENASDAVKEVAQLISRRTENRRIEKQRAEERRIQEAMAEAMRIGSPHRLSVFRNANRSVLSDNDYQDILARFQNMHSKFMGSHGGTKPSWEESATMISLFEEWSHWVGHDDTVTESIKLTLSRETTIPDNMEWSPESDWPCCGQALLFDKSWSRAPDNWDYTYVTHKAWLLKEPYGMPGVWRFEYESLDER